jgi:hypothetical protein
LHQNIFLRKPKRNEFGDTMKEVITCLQETSLSVGLVDRSS